MLDRKSVDRVLRLHRMSYELLQWVNANVETGSLSFETVHDRLSHGEATTEWLRRTLGRLPVSCRPAVEDLKPLGFLLASYLATSFELPANPVPYLSRAVCHCPCCRYLVSGRRLVLRTPSAKDVGQAHRLKALWLRALAEELGIPIDARLQEDFFSDKALSHELSFVAYAAELLRRTEFETQGVGVLALWRSIAWKDGRPIKKFALTADRVLEAEDEVTAGLRAAAAR